MENEIARGNHRQTNQNSLGYSQKLQAFLLPHAVSVFLDNYPHAKDYKELYLELGDGAVKFSARCMVNEPTNHLSSAIHELWDTSIFANSVCITLNCSLHLALLQEIPYLNRPPYRFYMQPLFKLNIRFCGQTSPSFRSLCSLQMNFILPKFYTQY